MMLEEVEHENVLGSATVRLSHWSHSLKVSCEIVVIAMSADHRRVVLLF